MLEFGKPVEGSPNYNCDNPLHGYGCFHLDPDRASSKLSKSDQEEFEKMLKEFYIESLEELDRELDREEEEIRIKEDELHDLRDDLDGLMHIKLLWEKSGLPDDWGKEFLRSQI